jgi:3-isopropylmalate/(R)-2-methylmalate dehydratase small subunit
VELPAEDIERLFAEFAGKPATIETDLANNRFIIKSEGREVTFDFSISGYDRALVEAGGWVDFADAKY